MTQARQVNILVARDQVDQTVRRMSRRGFLAGTAGVGAAAALASCSSTMTTAAGGSAPSSSSTGLSGKPIESKLVLANYADYVDPANLTSFTAAAGPKVTLEIFGSGEEMIAKVNGGGAKWDVVVGGTTEVNQLKQLNLLRPLDKALIPNIGNLLPSVVNNSYDSGNVYSVPKAFGVVGFYWRKSRITGAEGAKSNGDIFEVIKQNKGRNIWFFSTAKESFTIALSAVGKPIGSEDPADIELAKQALLSIKPFITNYGNDQLSAGQAGKIDLALGYNAPALQIDEALKDDTVEFLLPSVGSTEYFVDNWTVPVAAEDPVAAHAFINYMLQPEIAAKEENATKYQTPVKGTQPYLDKALASVPYVNVTDEQLSQYETLVATPTYLDLVAKAYAEFKAA